jgi:IS1 family transposase
MQQFVHRLPQASRYCTDALRVYQELLWPEGSDHVVSEGKEDTYTAESVNADLRTYLGRLKRRSRCFSRCWEALARAVRLFVWHYNRRRRMILQHPKYRHALPLLF